MHDLKVGEYDLLSFVKPDTLIGAGVYLLLFVILALLLSRILRAAVHTATARQGHIDRTTVSFLQQIGTAAIWIIMLILYAHLIPALRAMGTALLAGASIASVVIGLAAQSTLGNLVAGIAITLYRPFRLGDTLQVTAPTGTEVGTVELISLGYTTLRTADARLVVLPNSIAASDCSGSCAGAGASTTSRESVGSPARRLRIKSSAALAASRSRASSSVSDAPEDSSVCRTRPTSTSYSSFVHPAKHGARHIFISEYMHPG